VRRRAVKALSVVYDLTERIIQVYPKAGAPPVAPLLAQILRALKAGLLFEQEGRTQSHLAAVREAVAVGLLTSTQDGKPTSLVTSAAERVSGAVSGAAGAVSGAVHKAAELVKEELWRDTTVIGGIALDILGEDKAQTYVQTKFIARDVRKLRKRFCPDVQDDYLIKPTISVVHEFPDNHEIHAIAVANGGGKVCVGGLEKDARRYFLQEKAIEWLEGSFRITPGLRFTGHIWEGLLAGKRTSPKVDARVVGITYDPNVRTLFALCYGGLVRAFAGDAMQEYQIPEGLPVARPFVWVPGVTSAPFVLMWEHSDGIFRLGFAPTRAGATDLMVDAAMREFLDRFTSEDPRDLRPESVRVRVDKQLAVVAGPNALAVARFGRGASLELLAEMTPEKEIRAVDISAEADCVVFGSADGSISLCQLDRGGIGEPIELLPASAERLIRDLYLGAGGDTLAVVSGSEITLHWLDGHAASLPFDTGGAEVTDVAQSQDRQSLGVATEANTVMLFTFGLRL